jgi:hypothetical protein
MSRFSLLEQEALADFGRQWLSRVLSIHQGYEPTSSNLDVEIDDEIDEVLSSAF